jgi:hypothetical protein
MVNTAGSAATFDSAQGQAVLQALHTMRFVDHSMSPTQHPAERLAVDLRRPRLD